MITEFLRGIDEEVLTPINVGAAQSMKEANRLLAPHAIGFSGFDAGTFDHDVLNDPEKPCYGLHGGQFSFMLNFVLLETTAAHIGARDVVVELQKEFVGRSLGTNVMSLMDVLASHPNLPKDGQWEIDRLILKTLEVINRSYESPYPRSIDFPVSADMPSDHRSEFESLLKSLKSHGVPDTIAYLTEEEVTQAMPGLEELGYDREGIMAVFRVPSQGVDYYHFSFAPQNSPSHSG